jgi:hypothetical protein
MPKPCTGKSCHNNRNCAKLDCPGNSCFHAGEHYFIKTCHGMCRTNQACENHAYQRHRHGLPGTLLVSFGYCADIMDVVAFH